MGVSLQCTDCWLNQVSCPGTCTGSWLLLLLVFVLQPCGNDNRWWKKVSKDAEKHENVIGSAVVSLQCHSLKSCTETKESQKHWILYVNKQHCQGYTCKKWSYFAQIQANSLMPWCSCFAPVLRYFRTFIWYQMNHSKKKESLKLVKQKKNLINLINCLSLIRGI